MRRTKCLKKKEPIESKTLYEFDISDNKIIRISSWENEGKKIIDIRNWVKRRDGVYVATRKGLSVEEENLTTLIQCLQGV